MIRRMKRLIVTLSVLLVLGSCTTSEDVVISPVVQDAEMINVVVRAEQIVEAEDDTRLAIDGNATRWEVGDKFSAMLITMDESVVDATFEITSNSAISADGRSASFEGLVPAGSYSRLIAYYPSASIMSYYTISLDRQAANNLFMVADHNTSFTISEESNELPISFQHLMHKVDYKLSLADGYSTTDLQADNIAIEMTATDKNGVVSFPQVQTYKLVIGGLTTTSSSTSNWLYVTNHDFVAEPTVSMIMFPENTHIDMAFTFNIYIDNEKRYEITKPARTMKMSSGRSTVVNLVLSEENRVAGGTVIEQSDITLVASKSTLMANGSDTVQLTVTEEDGTDVTLYSSFYANGQKLTSNTFKTFNPGSYTIYAEKNGVRSNEVVLTAEAVTESGKTIVFAEGVTLTSGWYDVNKYGQGDNGDINMCWAAASSNMIQWFQDRYVAAGNTLPSTAVSGPGRNAIGDKAHTYELAVMELFWSEWNNDRGGHMEQAIPWYFEGVLNGGEYASSGSQAVPLTDGGYWKDIWSDVTPYMYCDYDSTVGYTTCFNNYYLWGNGTDYLGVERLKIVSDIIVDAFEHGMAGLTISLAANISSVHHATTLWGYEIDNATGLVTRLWITDSDDLTSQPKQPLLNEYSVSIADGMSHVKLTGNTRYGACYIVSIHPLSGYKR